MLPCTVIVIIRLSKSLISMPWCGDRLPIEEGENCDLTDDRIIASGIICLSDPLMRIFLRRRNFHNFLVRLGISKNFVARPSTFLAAIASFPLIQNMRLHESPAACDTVTQYEKMWYALRAKIDSSKNNDLRLTWMVLVKIVMIWQHAHSKNLRNVQMKRLRSRMQ